MSLLIVGLNNTIVNVALPSIGRELHTSVSGQQWTVDAYTLVLAGLLMLSGSMADRFGRRRVFELGLVLFTLGSLLCSAAPSEGWLIAFRMLQAIGGSMLNPVARANDSARRVADELGGDARTVLDADPVRVCVRAGRVCRSDRLGCPAGTVRRALSSESNLHRAMPARL